MINSPTGLAPNDLQLHQRKPLQDLRITFALGGGAQDGFGDELNVRGMDRLGKRRHRGIKRLLHQRDHFGREGSVGEIFHRDADKNVGCQCAFDGRDCIGSRLRSTCPSFGRLLNFPDQESFPAIGKFAPVGRSIAMPMPVVTGRRRPFNLAGIFRPGCGFTVLDPGEDSGRRTAPVAPASLR